MGSDSTPPRPPSSQAGLLRGVTAALQILLESTPLDSGIPAALSELGNAANVDRVYLFENHADPITGAPVHSQRFECARNNASPQIGNPSLQNVPWDAAYARWRTLLSSGRHLASHVVDLPVTETELLIAQGIQSIALVPVFSEGVFWGYIGFDACQSPREWDENSIEALYAAAAGIGAALSRQKSETALTARTAQLTRSRRIALSLMEDARIAERTAAAASAAKSSFLAMMSHEIRTPLNSIMGFTDLILSEDASPTVQSYAENVRSSSRLLLSLVNDVLDFARIEAKQITLSPESGDLREAVERIVGGMRQIAEQKSIALEIHIADDVPKFVTLDFARLHQILLNLAGNALKFTDAGSVQVRVENAPIDQASTRLVFEVEDTGTGISPVALDQIFEPFIQAHNHIHKHFGGAGLGLAICKQLCQRMGGSISATSAPGVGSCFRFEVLALIDQHGPARAEKALRPHALPRVAADRPLRVLVVDDVAANRQLACALIRKMGHETEIADSGETAGSIASTRHFDVILMDILLPGIDGHEATRRILAQQKNSEPPPRIIGLSADVMPENRQRGMDAGMVAFLTKPIRVDELIAELTRAGG